MTATGMNRDFSGTYFDLFGLTEGFAIDATRLDAAYRDVQSEVHPDRYASASGAEQRRSMQWATYANEAYQTLKKPLPRARYLIKLHGVDTEEETNTAMPAEFLMQQMEWREAVSEAKAKRDERALEQVSGELRQAQQSLLGQLRTALDEQHDFPSGATLVRELRFLEKLEEEIADAREDIAL